MTVRLAETRDFPDILKIYDRARRFMAENGNPTQWPPSYPSAELLREDMEEGHLFVVTDKEQVRGVFSFLVGPDHTYERIEDGAWHSDREYGTIHRIAGDGSGGIFDACLAYCKSKCDYLRIDTHENNKVMQHVVTKNGFRRCGIIYTDNGTPRIAFDRMEA
ncbi:MAG: GNAT family N-acetyltransferase [Oscillospiraceae bacterium]|nr:GNAT family N-acetyltransferase [Oscillospiraceae bacterium]